MLVFPIHHHRFTQSNPNMLQLPFFIVLANHIITTYLPCSSSNGYKNNMYVPIYKMYLCSYNMKKVYSI